MAHVDVAAGGQRDNEEISAYVAAEHLPDEATAARDSQVRHWTAEAAAILMERAHWEVFRVCREPDFQPDCRWIAQRIGCTVDKVNVVFARLLRLRLVETDAKGRWIATESAASTEREFRRLALKRIRAMAAEFHIKLPRGLEK